MMFVRRWLFHSHSSSIPEDYWPDHGGMYSRSSQLSSGNSISSKNDFTSLLVSVESRRAMANGENALNHPEISSGEKSPDF